ncbi:MAG: hypothetical protein MUF75_10830 [Bacteroidia bacterium]|jgi:hypothetical protein|nr:hypothetical protein [Bacteroidia bacterium]
MKESEYGGLWQDTKHWKWGGVYYNPQDDRIFVLKKIRKWEPQLILGIHSGFDFQHHLDFFTGNCAGVVFMGYFIKPV